jgi:signal transduction histidine kinase
VTWLRPDRAQRREPIWFVTDALVAVIFVWITVESLRSTAYIDEFGPVEGWAWLLAISPTLLLPLRRLAPVSMLAASTALYMIISAFQGDSNAPLAIPFFAYSVGLTRSTWVSGAMVGCAAAAMSTSVFYGPGDPILVVVPLTFMLFAIGWLVAVSIRYNQARAGALADEAAALRDEQAGIAAQAVADERARIARELHDAVGHAVNVIVMRAGAARLAATDETTVESLREIENVGRSALTDLDHMLGLLQDQGATPAPLEPARSTGDIARLVEETRAGGADVYFHDRCDGGIDLTLERPSAAAAYRIVQEALTNALKHAGPARIDVTIACTDRHLEVSVVDDGRGSAAPVVRGGGRGIAGMTERAHVLGGRLKAEPRPTGGFEVVAQIPRTVRPPRRFRGRSHEAAK